MPLSAAFSSAETRIPAAPGTAPISPRLTSPCPSRIDPAWFVDRLAEHEGRLLSGDARRQAARLAPEQAPRRHREQLVDAVLSSSVSRWTALSRSSKPSSTPSRSASQRQANHNATNALRLPSSSLVAAPMLQALDQLSFDGPQPGLGQPRGGPVRWSSCPRLRVSGGASPTRSRAA